MEGKGYLKFSGIILVICGIVAVSYTHLEGLSNALLNVKDKIKLCPECFSITDGDRCDVCADPSRNRKVICVVQSTKDIFAIEKTREYNGLYHVCLLYTSRLSSATRIMKPWLMIRPFRKPT